MSPRSMVAVARLCARLTALAGLLLLSALCLGAAVQDGADPVARGSVAREVPIQDDAAGAVSYTHLTLPTNREV